LAERAQLSCLVEPSVALVWNFADPMHPLCVLEAPSEVLAIKFNPSRPHLIVGGCMNGQILLWDISHALEAKPKQSTKTRAPQNQQEDVMHIPRMQPPLKGHTLEKDGDSFVSRIQPCQVSRAEFGHKRAVHDICWLPESLELDFAGKLEPGQDHNQFASISEDGTMMIWDLRPDRLSEKQKKMKKNKSKGGPGEDILWIPQMKWPITRPDGSGEALGLRIHLDGRVNGVPTYRMCCTTVEGEFCVCHFGPKDDKANQQTAYSEEGQKKELRMVRSLATAHAGPGWSVQRHPQLPDFFLTVGDWGFKIWKLGVTYPIIASPMGEYQMLCGRWSPTRASVVVVGTSDGFIQVWDLLDRSHEPTLFHRLSSDAISVLEFKPYAEKKPVAANAPANPNAINQLLVVGTKVGTFHLFDLPKVLVKGQTHELRQMKQLLDREVRRVAYFSWRWKERQKEMDRLVQEKADPSGAGGGGGAAASAPTKAKDDDLAEEDADFMYDAEADAAFLAKVEAFGKEEDEFTDEQASAE
jgi:WD40 repeat protein